MKTTNKEVPKLVARLVRGKKATVNVKIVGVSTYPRKAPYRFVISNNKVVLEKGWKNFGVLYAQICSVVRRTIKEKGEVSEQIKGTSKGQRKIHKKINRQGCYANQLAQQARNACD